MYVFKKEMKVFDMKNPNCEFLKKPAHCMFYNKPLVIKKGIYEDFVVGVIPEEAYIIEKEDGFYTEVIFWDDRYSKLNFKNYQVSGKVLEEIFGIKIFEITNIHSIEVG